MSEFGYPPPDDRARQLAIAQRITDILSIVVPTILLFITIAMYVRREYGAALLYLALTAFNVSCTVFINRLAERRRRRFKTELETLQRLLDEQNAP